MIEDMQMQMRTQMQMIDWAATTDKHTNQHTLT